MEKHCLNNSNDLVGLIAIKTMVVQ